MDLYNMTGQPTNLKVGLERILVTTSFLVLPLGGLGAS